MDITRKQTVIKYQVNEYRLLAYKQLMIFCGNLHNWCKRGRGAVGEVEVECMGIPIKINSKEENYREQLKWRPGRTEIQPVWALALREGRIHKHIAQLKENMKPIIVIMDSDNRFQKNRVLE